MPRLLLGETQQDLATAMVEYLSNHDYVVQLESNGLRILECLREKHFDVIVLEMSLKGLDGISVVRGYRSAGGSAPILLLSSTHTSDELKIGLDAGADAYFAKPFRLVDLDAQLRALMRRPALRSGKVLKMGSIVMDTGAGMVTKNDKPIHLHPMEFRLLQFLLSNPDQVFDAKALYMRVWQKDTATLNDTVRTHVRTLRQKIDSEGSESIISTVRGRGYKASMQSAPVKSR